MTMAGPDVICIGDTSEAKSALRVIINVLFLIVFLTKFIAEN